MASRENQGLHIALILLVMLTVGLCVLSFVFYSSAQKQKGLAETAANSLKTTQAAETKARFSAQSMAYMLSGAGKSLEQIATELGNIPGVTVDENGKLTSDDETLNPILQNYYNNMLLFGPANEEVESGRNYEALPTYLLSRLRDLNQQLADLRRTENRLMQEKANIEATANTRVKKSEEERDKARTDLAAERDKFNKDLADLRDQLAKLASTTAAKDDRIVDLNAQLEDQRSDFNKRIEELAKTVGDQRNKLRNLQETSLEVPDGIVTTVNQAENIVYINVGSADNLQVQQTFSVFDKGTTGVMNTKPKGRLEVLQVLGTHVAMCRVLEDQISNIIVPNDLIFSPAWSPGKRVHIALTGFIDITSNDRDDTALLTRLIELNGGTVDSDVTVQTRYLVQGLDRRENASAADAGIDNSADYEKKLSAAIEIGVDRISPDKLLQLMGWRTDISTITLGTGRAATVDGAKAEEENADESPFRRRTPPRGASGAF